MSAADAHPPSAPPPVRPLRADARRNRARLLVAAEAAFAEHGTEASLEDVARRAGVGIGTLYRHFPTRAAVLEGLLADRHDALLAQGAGLLHHPDAHAALRTWLDGLLSICAAYQGVAAALTLTCHDDDLASLHPRAQALEDQAGRLLARAQQAGTVRPAVTVADLLDLTSAAAWAADRAGAGLDRARALLDLSLAGVG